MHVVIFEDNRWAQLAPLSLSRPVFTLSTGMSSLLEKQIRHLAPTRLSLWVRPEMEAYCRQSLLPKIGRLPTTVNEPLDDQRALLVNGRTLHFARYNVPEQEGVVADEGEQVRTALWTAPGLSPADVLNHTDRWKQIFALPPLEPQTRLTSALWDLIAWNKESLAMDAHDVRGLSNIDAAIPCHLLNPKAVFQSRGVRIEPGVVLDARDGPIVLADGVTVGANTVIQGPVYLGPWTYVRPVSIIRPGVTVGTACKIGGEISNSIIFGYSNKSHDGYLGDSYVGKWVNLGALTTTSNLKNTYSEVSIDMGHGEVKTGRPSLGSLIGDHTKTAILTRLMTGSYIGYSSMIASSSICPRFVPSFRFISDKGDRPYELERAMEVARRMMSRRERPFNEMEEGLMRYALRASLEVEGRGGASTSSS